MDIQELLNKTEIREVIDRFSALEIDVKAQAKLFTPDTKITIFNGNQKLMEINSRDEMIKKFDSAMASAKSSYHMNGQQVIELQGNDQAKDIHYCQATIENEKNGKNVLNVSYIRYTDTLVKQNDQWLISQREQHIIFTKKHVLD